MSIVRYTVVAIAIVWFAGLGILSFIRDSNLEHREYIAASKIDMSDLKVGQSINLQDYDINLESGNANILKVRTSDDNGLFSDNKNVVWAVSAGNTTLMIHDKSSNAYKIIKVRVE